MDEPFSALDVLTAETLRTDLLDLWLSDKLPIKSILIVTHNIEEAVFMCDRILLLAANPGRLAAEIKIEFPHPRNRLDPAFRQRVDDIYAKMTARGDGSGARATDLTVSSRLSPVSTNLMSGFLETVGAEPYHGRADMPDIASRLHLEIDDLFPIGEVLQYLRFAEMQEGDITLTALGKSYVEADTQQRKALFAKQLLSWVPLAERIRTVLQERPGRIAPRARFQQELEDTLSDTAADQTIDAIIRWGRYAEIFSYDDKRELFGLDDIEA
jgi:NitT/TauT family transport system ATP-binding protein